MVHSHSFLHGRNVNKTVHLPLDALQVHKSTKVFHARDDSIVDLVEYRVIIQLDWRGTAEVIIALAVTSPTFTATIPPVVPAAIFANRSAKLIQVVVIFAVSLGTS